MKKLRPKVTQQLDAGAELRKVCLTQDHLIFSSLPCCKVTDFLMVQTLWTTCPGVSSFLVASATHCFPRTIEKSAASLDVNGLMTCSGSSGSAAPAERAEGGQSLLGSEVSEQTSEVPQTCPQVFILDMVCLPWLWSVPVLLQEGAGLDLFDKLGCVSLFC